MTASGTQSTTSPPPPPRPNSFLLDTNIIIPSEDDDKEVMESLARMHQLCSENGIKCYVHESSDDDINRDKNEERKKRSLSKLQKYPRLAKIDLPNDKRESLFGRVKDDNDRVDTDLLYSLQSGNTDYLITEDTGVHARVRNTDLQARVLYVAEAVKLLTLHFEPKLVYYPHVATSDCKAEKLDSTSPFFDPLRADYGTNEFNTWLDKCISGRRACFIIRGDKAPSGIIIIDPQPKTLEKHRTEQAQYNVGGFKVLKLCLFRLEDEIRGEKYGEHLLKVAMDYGFQNDFDTLFLTVFPKHAPLIHLIEKFGFKHVEMKGEERVYAKSLVPPARPSSEGFEFHKEYWPNIDLRPANHYLIPIRPEYHNRLFPELTGKIEPASQIELPINPSVATPGNAIRKVYVCNAPPNEVPPGSILWFYRSEDGLITTIGILERYQTTKQIEELRKLVGSRSVYQPQELKERLNKPEAKARVIDFYYAFHLAKPIASKELKELGIAPPRTLRKLGGADKRKLLDKLSANDTKYFYAG